MANETKERTVAVIQKEYTELCVKAGHLQYQLHILKQDLDTVNRTLSDLNLEAAAAHAQESEQKKGE